MSKGKYDDISVLNLIYNAVALFLIAAAIILVLSKVMMDEAGIVRMQKPKEVITVDCGVVGYSYGIVPCFPIAEEEKALTIN